MVFISILLREFFFSYLLSRDLLGSYLMKVGDC